MYVVKYYRLIVHVCKSASIFIFVNSAMKCVRYISFQFVNLFKKANEPLLKIIRFAIVPNVTHLCFIYSFVRLHESRLLHDTE